MNDLYVVVTRYAPPKGKIIKHAYGPYINKADGDHCRKVLLDQHWDVLDHLEVSVLKVLDG